MIKRLLLKVFAVITLLSLIAIPACSAADPLQGTLYAQDIGAPIGRGYTFVVASTTYASVREKAQADIVTDDGIAAWNAAIATFPSYTFIQPSTGTAVTGKIGTIKWSAGRFTFASQWNIPSAYNVALISDSPHPSIFGTAATQPYAYQGGTEFYFSGGTYPVFNMPLGAEGFPTNGLDIKNIIFTIKNPAAMQANTVYAFNMDGWNSGTWDSVFFLNDTASTPKIKCISVKSGWDHDRLQISSMSVYGFAGYAVTFYVDHLYIGTLSIGATSTLSTGESGKYALYITDCSMIINRLHIYTSVSGVNINATYSKLVEIGNMDAEGATNPVINTTGGVQVKVGSYTHADSSALTRIDKTLWTMAQIDQLIYSSAAGYGGRINSIQGVGLSSIEDVNYILPLLGDVRGLWLFEDYAGTVTPDYSPKAHNGAANRNTSVFTYPMRIKGRTNLAVLDSTAEQDYFTVADNADYTFGNGVADSAFSMGIASYLVDYVWGGDLITKYAANNKEYEFALSGHNATIYFKIYDEVNGGSKTWTANLTSPNNAWHVFVVTFDGTTPIIYDKGASLSLTPSTSGAYTAMSDKSAAVGIGARSNGDGSVTGYQIAWPFITGTQLSFNDVWTVTKLIKSALEIT